MAEVAVCFGCKVMGLAAAGPWQLHVGLTDSLSLSERYLARVPALCAEHDSGYNRTHREANVILVPLERWAKTTRQHQKGNCKPWCFPDSCKAVRTLRKEEKARKKVPGESQYSPISLCLSWVCLFLGQTARKFFFTLCLANLGDSLQGRCQELSAKQWHPDLGGLVWDVTGSPEPGKYGGW